MWHSMSTVTQPGQGRAHQTHHHGRLYAIGYTAQHTAQPHGAHSQEWPEPHRDPHTVGNGFGNGKYLTMVACIF